MEKAIIITEKNRKNNYKYLSNRSLGSVAIFSDKNFPKVWKTDKWTKEYFDKRSEFHEEAGFFDVIKPVKDVDYNESTQYLGEIKFDKNIKKFIYPIIDMNQDQIDALAGQIFESSVSEESDNTENAGQQIIDTIKKELIRRRKKNQITDEEFLNAQDVLFDLILPLHYGMFKLSQKRMNDYGEPNTQPYKAIYQYVKSLIDDYISQNKKSIIK